MKGVLIRKAKREDRQAIALCIAEGFERDFSLFSKNVWKVATALAPGIQTERFYVVEFGGEIIAVAGISDCTGRAVYTVCRSLCRQFGWIKGLFARLVLKAEFEHRLPYPPDTGFIEFVAVRKEHRRKGMASALLKESMAAVGYKEYVLDVIVENVSAMNCYRKLGFHEFERRKQRNGYTKVYMRYLENQ